MVQWSLILAVRASAASLAAVSIQSLRIALAGLASRLHRIAFDRYRPERHYMRGPGPKWHEKHGTAPASRTADTLSGLPA
jgi:hypothetical protein